VLQVAVSRGMHRYRFNAEFTATPQNTQGNFAPVCDQYFI
jgi:hypothetical protein